MSDALSRIVAALERRRLTEDLAAEDLADALWLAARIERVAPDARETSTEPRTETPPPPRAADTPAPEGQSALEPRPDAKSAPKRTTRQDPARTSPSAGEWTAAGVPDAPLLAGRAEITKALRKALPRVPTEDPGAIDEAATAARVAYEGLVLPVLRRTFVRKLAATLVVDDGVSMALWRSLAPDLERALRRSGAFRDVRTWELHGEESSVTVRAGLSRDGRHGIAQPPDAIADPTGRRVILVFTDCVGPAWRSGIMARTLGAWARSTPVALIHALPRYMAARTALGRGIEVALRPTVPFGANGSYAQEIDPLLAEEQDPEARTALPFPVVTLDAPSMSALARLLAGNEVWVPGVSWPATSSLASTGAAPAKPLSALERVQRFRRTASPTARRLAVLLAAAAPLRLSIIRRVRQAVLPEAQHVHEAEVLLGGILELLSPGNGSPDDLELDFADGVRSLLLNDASASEALAVLRTLAQLDSVPGAEKIRVLFEKDTRALAGAIQPNAGGLEGLAAEVLVRIGGQFAELVAGARPAVGDSGARSDESGAGAERARTDEPEALPRRRRTKTGSGAKGRAKSRMTILVIESRLRQESLFFPGSVVGEIEAALRGARYGDRFTVTPARTGTVAEVSRLLAIHQPTILHLAWSIAADEMEMDAFRSLATALPSSTRLAFLGFPYDPEAARAFIPAFIPAGACFVIYKREVREDVLGRFAVSFYGALGGGASVGTAFALAVRDLRTLEYDERPEFHLMTGEGVDPGRITLVREPPFQVPFLPSPYFVGRQAELDALHQLLRPDGDAPAPPFAVSGMAGVGKTHLVVEYAYRYRDKYPGGIYWLVAQGTDWRHEIQHIAARLRLGSDVGPESDAGRARIEAVFEYLDARPDALVIFDDVDDPDDLETDRKAGFVPAELGCSVLFTTRRVTVSRTRLQLAVLSPGTALDLLIVAAERTQMSPEERQAATEIVAELGNLPLALMLAAGFLSRRPDMSLADFLERIRAYGPLDATETNAVTSDELSTRHEASVEATLRAQLDEVRSGDAWLLLRVVAIFGDRFEAMPRAWVSLLSGLSDAERPGHRAPLAEALAELWTHSLVEEAANASIRVHPLVRAVVLTMMPEGMRGDLARSCAERAAFALGDMARLQREVEARGVDEVIANLRQVSGLLSNQPAASNAHLLASSLARSLDREAHVLRKSQRAQCCPSRSLNASDPRSFTRTRLRSARGSRIGATLKQSGRWRSAGRVAWADQNGMSSAASFAALATRSSSAL